MLDQEGPRLPKRHSVTFHSKALEIYKKTLVRKSDRDSQIMEFNRCLTAFNLSNTQVTVHPPAILSGYIGLLQGYERGEVPIVLIPLICPAPTWITALDPLIGHGLVTKGVFPIKF